MTKDNKPASRQDPSPVAGKQQQGGMVKPWHGVMGNWSVAGSERPLKETRRDRDKRG